MTMSDIHYDARYGWQYRNHAGELHCCPPPFGERNDPIRYALARLQATNSCYSQIIDARAALEWALAQTPAPIEPAGRSRRDG